MGRVFISYRRDDSAAMCGSIYRELAAYFGREAIFKDVDSLPLGVDFEQYIERDVLPECSVLLAVIGARWLTITGKNGTRRLGQADVRSLSARLRL